MKNFKEILQAAKAAKQRKIAVAVAEDTDVIRSLASAQKAGIASGYLIGNIDKIKKISDLEGLDLSDFEIICEDDKTQAAIRAVKLVSSGKAEILMKGLVDTSIILKAALNKDFGLRNGSILSHVAVFKVNNYNKLLFVTDAAMNIAPDLEAKKQILLNCLDVTNALGICPYVAAIAAKEKVSDSMQATVDAGKLKDFYAGHEGFVVGGPFGLDNAISKEAAEIKGINDPVAGNADVLLMPNIESGNVLYKALNFLAGAESAGIIVGAKAPIVLTSRADSDESKLNSIALAVMMAEGVNLE